VAPRDTLVDQIGVDFIRDGVLDTTVLQGGKRYRPDARFKIASLQTVDRRAGQAGAYPDFDFVVFDECHMWTSATYKWMEARPETIFLGLTATPGMPRMGEYYEERIVGATVKHLLGLGYLAPIRAFAPKATAIDLSSVRIVAGDYDEEGLIREVDNAKITGDIVKHYQEFGQAGPRWRFASIVGTLRTSKPSSRGPASRPHTSIATRQATSAPRSLNVSKRARSRSSARYRR
jgi:DNA repair protein RadD